MKTTFVNNQTHSIMSYTRSLTQKPFAMLFFGILGMMTTSCSREDVTAPIADVVSGQGKNPLFVEIYFTDPATGAIDSAAEFTVTYLTFSANKSKYVTENCRGAFARRVILPAEITKSDFKERYDVKYERSSAVETKNYMMRLSQNGSIIEKASGCANPERRLAGIYVNPR